jgi:DNA-binding beta-propeller fold protein YncE
MGNGMEAARLSGADRQLNYRVVEGFFRRPRKWTFVEVVDADVDTEDNVYVFSRSPHPVMIFDRQGNFLDNWGELSDRYFSNPHGITVGPDGYVYTADTGDHTIRKFTNSGKLLMTLGRPNQNAPAQSGKPFNMPTKVDIASNGDIYVSDGYQNSHMHVFDAAGNYKFNWGSNGSGPGQFDTPHGIYVDRTDGDRVYVADRHNNRVQVFTSNGEFITEWKDLLMPNSVRKGPDGEFVVPELYQRVSVLDRDGKILARFGDEGAVLDDSDAARGGLPTAPSRNPMLKGIIRNEPGAGKCCAPHGAAVDGEGSLYIAEVSESRAGLDRGDRSIQKFIRVET